MPDDTTDAHESPDDALEPQDRDGLYLPGVDQEKEENDYDTPASAPDDIPLPDNNPNDDQALDTSVDPGAAYDEGALNEADVTTQHEGPDEAPRPLDTMDES